MYFVLSEPINKIEENPTQYFKCFVQLVSILRYLLKYVSFVFCELYLVLLRM